ncbi:MAG: ribosome maturation factor RimP [Anaerovoracaceae bacterium]
MAKKKVTELVEVELIPFFDEKGYQLYHIEFVKEGKDWFLRVFIEKKPDSQGNKPEGITTDDCEVVSRYLGQRLDELDPIEQNYYLEVSSPGMDRLLIKDEHFERYRGEKIALKFYSAKDGRKTMEGRLLDKKDGKITLEDEKGQQNTYSIDEIASVRLAIGF